MIEKCKRRKSREDWQESRKEKRKRPSKGEEKKRDLLKPERSKVGRGGNGLLLHHLWMCRKL